MTNSDAISDCNFTSGSEIAVKIDNLSKSYKIFRSPVGRIKELLHPFDKKYHRDFWALKDINLEIPKGTTFGIIGRNGSGKSTLLQLIAGILRPTEGCVAVNGRVSALLELRTGFSPQFTGRENIHLKGTIMGLSRDEILERIDDIVTFADIGDFIDQPVKTYSSGMYVRLAFAVAINVDPDILLVDEALAVGDKYFRLRCMERMKELKDIGTTMLFVSHSIYAIKNMCSKAVWIDEGRLSEIGDAREVADRYDEFIGSISTGSRRMGIEKEEERQNWYPAKINDVAILDKRGSSVSRIRMFDEMNINLEYVVKKNVGPLAVGFAIKDASGYRVCGTNTHLYGKKIVSHTGVHSINIKLSNILLYPGTYSLDIGLFNDETSVSLDFRRSVNGFRVYYEKHIGDGLVHLEPKWEQQESSPV